MDASKDNSSSQTLRSGERLFYFALFGFHLMAAAGWWWIMPGGFPLTHLRFWANCGGPALIGTIAIVGLSGVWLRRREWSWLVATVFASFWTTAFVAAIIVFPHSRKLPFAVVFLASVVVWGRLWGTKRSAPGMALWHAIPFAVAGMLLGALLPWTQIAPDADTEPLNLAIPVADVTDSADRQTASGVVRLNDRVRIDPGSGEIHLNTGLQIELSPLLTFVSRSVDRGWTCFAKTADRIGPRRVCSRFEQQDNSVRLDYRCDGDEVLQVNALDNGTIAIEAFNTLPTAVFSHLNTFNRIFIHGHAELDLAFSPCPDVLIEAMPSDYPIGRPARFAYLDTTGIFHVVEASSGEKGPFQELASGRLERSDPLVVTFHDRKKPVCRLTFDDWPQQCGTQLSPTAGWRVPVNAIEFTRTGNSRDSPVFIWMTLAGTSVGRGFDSVGHRAGIYRNRVQIEEVAE